MFVFEDFAKFWVNHFIEVKRAWKPATASSNISHDSCECKNRTHVVVPAFPEKQVFNIIAVFRVLDFLSPQSEDFFSLFFWEKEVMCKIKKLEVFYCLLCT